MPNYCRWKMHVQGDPASIEVLAARLRGDMDAELFFPRANLMNTFEMSWLDSRTASLEADCAWSVYSCMFDGSNTYKADAMDPSPYATLEDSSRELALKIEVYSNEPGVGFAEHYLFENGEELINETTDYKEFFYDPDEWESFEHYKNDLVEFASSRGDHEAVREYFALDEMDFDERGIYATGGFPEIFFDEVEAARSSKEDR